MDMAIVTITICRQITKRREGRVQRREKEQAARESKSEKPSGAAKRQMEVGAGLRRTGGVHVTVTVDLSRSYSQTEGIWEEWGTQTSLFQWARNQKMSVLNVRMKHSS